MPKPKTNPETDPETEDEDEYDDDELKEVIEKMIKEGKTSRQIQKELHIGWPRFSRIYKRIKIEKGDKIEPPLPTDQEIINRAAEWASEKSARTLSDSIHKDYISTIMAAQILREAESRYRKTLEQMGWKWEEFLKQAIEYGFKKAQELEELESTLKLMSVGA